MGSIISVASGKGGVGKSFTAVSLALSLKNSGKKVLVVDCDLGSANLHNFLTIDLDNTGVYSVLRENQSLKSVTQTSESGIDFIGGAADILGMAHITKFEKNRLVNKLKMAPYDFVVVDLGAGTSLSMVDFFNISDRKVLVTSSEPTAIENGYGFLKVATYRYVERFFSLDVEFADICKKLRSRSFNFEDINEIKDSLDRVKPDSSEYVDQYLKNTKIKVVVNFVREKFDIAIFSGFKKVVSKYTGLDVELAGFMPYDIKVSDSLKQGKIYYRDFANEEVKGCIDDMRKNIVK